MFARGQELADRVRQLRQQDAVGAVKIGDSYRPAAQPLAVGRDGLDDSLVKISRQVEVVGAVGRRRAKAAGEQVDLFAGLLPFPRRIAEVHPRGQLFVGMDVCGAAA